MQKTNLKTQHKLYTMLVSCSTDNEMFCFGQVFKTLNLRICKFLDIYMMWTSSSSAYSNNPKLAKAPKLIKLGLFMKPRFKKNELDTPGWAFKKTFFQPCLDKTKL